MKQKKKKAKKGRFFLWILLLMACTGGGYHFLHSDFFLIENVEVTGNERVSTAAVLNLGDIEVGSNMFTLDTRFTEKAIELHQLVKQAEVKRKIPSTIEIQIQERKPWAQMMVGDRCLIIDDESVYMEESSYIREEPDLLLISLDDSYAEPLNFGQPVCPEAAAMVQAVYQALTPAFCDQYISEYHYQSDTDMLVLYMLSGMEIRFGNLERLEMKVGYINEIQKKELENQQTGESGISYVDMRFEGMPTIRDL